MKITIELERADMTPEASAALAIFLNTVPATPEKAAPRRRVPAKAKVVETPPASEAGDAPLTSAPAPTAAAAAPSATPVAQPAAPAPTAAPTPAAAAQPAAAPAAAAAPAPVVPSAAPTADLDGLRTALREHAAAHSREAAIEVLKVVGGAVSVSAIDPANIPATIAALAQAPIDPLA